MKAEIITIGDEILIGQIVDTNSVFIAKELNKIGVSVHQISSIQDDRLHILKALQEAENRADIIIITGGLGPTKDDITKHTLCDYFNDVLIQDDSVLKHVIELLTQYAVTISDINTQQALVLSKAIILHNERGTAPGMCIRKGKKVFISLPGVPHEMKGLMEDEVIPKLKSDYELPHIFHKTIITQGEAESVLANRISDWEDALPSFIKLAYLPSFGVVRLRLSAIGAQKLEIEAKVEAEVEKLIAIIDDVIIGYDEDSPVIAIKKILLDKKQTLSVAESCTGGLIASSITQNEGVSPFFKGGIVTYQTETKTAVLNVAPNVIAKNSVVSKAVAYEMAVKVKAQFKSDFAIATTGNAGPTKGDSEADIGTVFIAIATPKSVIVEEFNFGNNRFRVIECAKNKAFELLRKEIIKS